MGNIMNSKVVVAKPLKKLFSDKRLAIIIDKLRNIKRVGYYSYIERSIGLKPYKLSSIIRKFQELGVEFTVSINYSKIGLNFFTVITRSKILDSKQIPYFEWVRSYGILKNDLSTYIQYYIPIQYRDELIKEIINKLKDIINNENIEYFYFNDIIRLQPKLSSYDNISSHPIIKGYRVNDLEKIFKSTKISSDNSMYDLINKSEEHEKNRPHDIVDLKLLKEFEKDALLTIYQISEKHSMKLRVLAKHLKEHIIDNEIIRGIYMKSGIFIKYIGKPVMITIGSRSYENILFMMKFFEKLENLIGIIYSLPEYNKYNFIKKMNFAQFILFETMHNREDLYAYLALLYREGFIDYLRIDEFILKTFRKFTIPYKNFYQENRYWDLDTEKTQMLYERRFLRRVS
jgi:DNA-binding Lrp family transcriptional regulator